MVHLLCLTLKSIVTLVRDSEGNLIPKLCDLGIVKIFNEADKNTRNIGSLDYQPLVYIKVPELEYLS